MEEVSFSVPVSGVVRIDEDTITITINRAETNIRFEPEKVTSKRISLEPGRTMFDVVLETARDVVRMKGVNRFTGAELYHEALKRYPELKRNSFTSHVIACAPNHPSYKHYTAKRDYFSYMRQGQYRLSDEYLREQTID